MQHFRDLSEILTLFTVPQDCCGYEHIRYEWARQMSDFSLPSLLLSLACIKHACLCDNSEEACYRLSFNQRQFSISLKLIFGASVRGGWALPWLDNLFCFGCCCCFFLQQDVFERRIQEENNNSTEKANSLLDEEKKRHKVWCLFLCGANDSPF